MLSVLRLMFFRSKRKAAFPAALFFEFSRGLDGLDVLGLPAFGALGHIELDLLAFLQ